MNRLVVDENLPSKLDQCTDRTELYDADGRILGVFVPEAVRERRMYDRIRAELTPERIAEIERRAQDPGPGYTTAEVMQKLRDLEGGKR
jgi:hypothetical protein